ncbi:transcription termination factor 1-like [Centruroides sculpturatus]|uniref:transcription termination factor 1-like n=1 Tax=Centruroides sculpturatus TaxID=218467 RepID=UPI000C6D11E1|nr:transcription termination factor 1-like [Centruroides sculpturatus]
MEEVANQKKKKKKEKKRKHEKNKDILQEGLKETKENSVYEEQVYIESVKDHDINNQKITNSTEIIKDNEIRGNSSAEVSPKKSKKRKHVEHWVEDDVNNQLHDSTSRITPSKSKKRNKDNLVENAKDSDEEKNLPDTSTKLEQDVGVSVIENVKYNSEVSTLEMTSSTKTSPTKSKRKKTDKTVESVKDIGDINSIIDSSILNLSPAKSCKKQEMGDLSDGAKDVSEVNNTVKGSAIEGNLTKSKKKKKHKNKDVLTTSDLAGRKGEISDSVSKTMESNKNIETNLNEMREQNSENTVIEITGAKKSKKKKKDNGENKNKIQNFESENLKNVNNDAVEGNEKKKKKKHKNKEKSDDMLFEFDCSNLNKENVKTDLQLTAINKEVWPNSENLDIIRESATNEASLEADTAVATSSSKSTKKKKKDKKHKKKNKSQKDDTRHKEKHKKNKKTSKKKGSKLKTGDVNVNTKTSVSSNEGQVEKVDIEHLSDEIFSNYDDDDNQDYFYDFEEEELDFEPPILHGNGYPSTLTKQQKERLSSMGIELRMGCWSKREDDILKRNWINLIKKYELKQPHILLGLSQKKSHVAVQKFIKAKKFYYQLAEDLNNRTIHSCYLRARKLFHPYRDENKKGWVGTSRDEVEDLQALVSVYGDKWTKIGHMVNRDGKNISEIIRWHRKNAVKGHWSAEEEENLIEAVKNVLQVNDVAGVYYGIQWEEVAKLVPSRNSNQCRQHWLLNTCWKINNDKPRERWKDTDTVRLIYHLYRLSTDNEKDIDWDALASEFDNVASYAHLKQKWLHFKQKVPGYQNKDFEDIITYLYCCYLPSLLEKVGKSYIKEIIETV